MKTCRLCSIEKPLNDFPKRSSSKDGHRNECKACTKEYHRANYQAKREQKLAQVAEYRASHKQEISDRDRRYRENNREILKIKKAEYYQANKAARQERMAAYAASPEGKAAHKAARHRRRALEDGAEGFFTAQEWNALIEQYPLCLCCKRTDVVLTADHIVPLSKGGTNWISNIQPLCRSCNSKKGISTADYRD